MKIHPLFRTQVSYLPDIYSPPKSLVLYDWILECRQGKQFKELSVNYRKSPDNAKKKKLPQLCAGAVLKGGHAEKHISERTGWLTFDIDDDHNQDISDWEDIRGFVAQIPIVAFAGLSVSGKGVWGLIHISNPEKQRAHFKQLQADFKKVGITLDASKGKNPTDKRAYSYDPEAYIAEDFEIYDRLPEKLVLFKRKPKPPPQSKTRKMVEEKLLQIELYTIPIAPDYPTYRDIGFAIASEFGELGRQYFHRAVQHHHKYNKKDADKQYTNCLAPGPIGIGTFFHICKKHNI